MDIKESLRKKLQGTRYYTDFQPEATRQEQQLTYEQVKLAGDVLEMLRHKTGYYKQLEQQAELDAMLSNLDIVAVTTELKGIDGKIEKAVNDHKAKLEKDKAALKDRYESELQQFFRRGGVKGSIHADIIVDNFQRELRGLEESGDKPDEAIQTFLDRKKLLTIARDTYIKENAGTIEQMRKARVMQDIEQAGLLD